MTIVDEELLICETEYLQVIEQTLHTESTSGKVKNPSRSSLLAHKFLAIALHYKV